MIRGSINRDLQPIAPLAVRDSRGNWLNLDAVVDTGFNGFLTMPAELVRELNLQFERTAAAELGDGAEIIARRYYGRVRFGSHENDVLVLESEGGVMVGMSLLLNLVVTMHVLPGAEFTIRG